MTTLQQEIVLNGHFEEIDGKEANLTKQLEECYKQEEIYWKQKS